MQLLMQALCDKKVFRNITEIHRVDTQVWVMETTRWRGEARRGKAKRRKPN
jgi:hypothetical protein